MANLCFDVAGLKSYKTQIWCAFNEMQLRITAKHSIKRDGLRETKLGRKTLPALEMKVVFTLKLKIHPGITR